MADLSSTISLGSQWYLSNWGLMLDTLQSFIALLVLLGFVLFSLVHKMEELMLWFIYIWLDFTSLGPESH